MEIDQKNEHRTGPFFSITRATVITRAAAIINNDGPGVARIKLAFFPPGRKRAQNKTRQPLDGFVSLSLTLSLSLSLSFSAFPEYSRNVEAEVYARSPIIDTGRKRDID